MALYSEKVMDHFTHPRNVGIIENADGVGVVGNAKCGDIMKMYLKIDENDVIVDCKFKTFGCGAAIATSSMATELIKSGIMDGFYPDMDYMEFSELYPEYFPEDVINPTDQLLLIADVVNQDHKVYNTYNLPDRQAQFLCIIKCNRIIKIIRQNRDIHYIRFC